MKWSNTADYSDTVECPKHAPLVYLDTNTVIKECCLDSKELSTSMLPARRAYFDEQFRTFGYNKFNAGFTSKLGITGNPEYFIGKIKFSYSDYITRLKSYLNANDLSEYSEHFKQKMLAKVDELKAITTLEELQIKFPEIYKDYMDGLDYYHNMMALEEFPSPDEYQQNVNHVRYVGMNAYYNRCGLKYVLKYFIERQAKMYEKMIRNMDHIMYYVDDHYLNGEFLKGIDPEKFELYVASEYLKKALSYKTNHPNKKLYIDLLKEYFAHAKNKNVKITNLETGEEISYTSLYADFLPFLSAKVDWVILSDANYEATEKNPKAKALKEEAGKRKVEESKEKKEDRIPDITDPRVIKELTGASAVGESSNMNFFDANKAKVLFYKDSGYIGLVKGVELNNGYIAFIYPNGCVVMDLIASKDNISNAIGNGIYVVKASEFIELSMLSKPVLRSLKEKREFLYHRGNWQERLDKIIHKEATEEEREASLELIRVLHKKR